MKTTGGTDSGWGGRGHSWESNVSPTFVSSWRGKGNGAMREPGEPTPHGPFHRSSSSRCNTALVCLTSSSPCRLFLWTTSTPVCLCFHQRAGLLFLCKLQSYRPSRCEMMTERVKIDSDSLPPPPRQGKADWNTPKYITTWARFYRVDCVWGGGKEPKLGERELKVLCLSWGFALFFFWAHQANCRYCKEEIACKNFPLCYLQRKIWEWRFIVAGACK